MAIVIDVAPATEPTDRSNSPAVIRVPTGMATMASSAAPSSQLAVPSWLMNPLLPARMAKMMYATIAEARPPASGSMISRCSAPIRRRPPSPSERMAACDCSAFVVLIDSGGAQNVRILLRGLDDLLDVRLADDRRPGVDRSHRGKTVLHELRGEQHAVVPVQVRLLV